MSDCLLVFARCVRVCGFRSCVGLSVRASAPGLAVLVSSVLFRFGCFLFVAALVLSRSR